MNYFLHLLVYLGIYTIFALSLNLVVGYCGLLTLCHAAYFAIGSYTTALAMLKLGWAFFPAVALGIAVAVLLSFLVSIPAWRFKGDFFVLVTLSVQVVIFSLIYNWTSTDAEVGTLANLTNGSFGISGIPAPNIFGLKVEGLLGMAILSVIICMICSFIIWLLVISPWGRLLKCMRDDELATRSLGKNVRLAKVQAFAIACGMVAAAGGIYASYVGYIDPSSFTLDQSILMLSMVIVGGLGNFRGPFVGAIVLLAIPELLRFANIQVTEAANIRLILYGLLLVLMMHFRPQGLAGNYRLE